MSRPAKAEFKVRVVCLIDNENFEDYNEGLYVGGEFYAYDKSTRGSVSVLIPTELEPERVSALFKGEYEIIEEY